MIVWPLARDLFNETFLQQVEKGRSRYGTLLKTFNGRNAFVDLLQEQADSLVYTTQLYMEAVVLGDLLDEALDLLERMLPQLRDRSLALDGREFAALARAKIETTGLLRE